MFATVLHRDLPDELDEMPPGPALAALLASIDVRALDDYDRVVVLRAHERMAAHHQAQACDAMVALVEVVDDEFGNLGEAMDAAAAEIRAALRLTRRAADVVLSFAWGLRVRVPQVWEWLRAGLIDQRRARVLVDGTCHLPPAVADEVIDRVAESAPRLTTGQLRARVRKLCLEADPEDATRRYEEAVAERRVLTEPTESGTTTLLGIDLPPHEVSAAMRRINEVARSLRGQGEHRTMDQLRADVLLDLLIGRHEAGDGGVVDIQVDLATLARLEESPGELAGYGPVIADIARRVADDQHQSEWRYLVTDPATGQVVHHGVTRRRPSRPQRRAVERRRTTCVFPGCRMPATGCDLDHREPWSEGGPTTEENLTPLCRHDHGLKTRFGWTYRPLPDGTIEWTSRLGHRYLSGGRPP